MAQLLVKSKSWFASSALSTVPVDARVDTMCTPGAVMSGWYRRLPEIPRGEGAEDEQDVAGADRDELRAGSDARVVARRRRPQTGCDPRDVRAVADRGLTVRQVLDEQVRCPRGLVDRALEREEIREVEENFDVLDGLVGVVQIGVVEAVDAGVQNRDPDPLAGD